jgi:hypothetical protein
MNWFDPETGKYDGKEREPDKFAYHNAFAPSMTDMVHYDVEDSELATKMQSIWRKVAEIELEGDYYPITECRGSTEDWYAMQFDNPKTRCGFVLIARNADAEEDSFLLKLPYIPELGIKYTFVSDTWIEEYSTEDLRKGIEIRLNRREAKAIAYYCEL